MSTTAKSNVFRLMHRHRDLIGLRYPKIVLVSVLSVIAGFGQAALLLVVVRTLTALTADTTLVSGDVGPFSAADLTVGQLIGVGFVVVVVVLVAQTAGAYAGVSLGVDATRRAKLKMLELYSGADFEAQTARPRGQTQFAVLGLSTRASGVVSGLAGLLSALMTFLALTGSALVLSPVAGVIVIAGMVALGALLSPLNRLRRRLALVQVDLSKKQQGLVVARFELAREARSYGVDKQIDGPIRDGIHDLARNGLWLGLAARMSSVGYQLGAFCMMLGMLALIDASNAQNLAALTGALLMLLRSLGYGQSAFSSYQALSQNAPIIEELAAEAKTFADAAEPAVTGDAITTDIGTIEFENVGFEYEEGEPVLHDVSFTIEQGDFAALVGPTGAGKSTIMQLLLRLRPHGRGTITVDGVPISDIPFDHFRSRIGYVAQDPKLLTGTVAEAIRFYRPGLSDDDVLLAARRAHVADEILGWPRGFDTPVGQMGEGVSGGQRQRIALARALVCQPDLLLLDEPTSALDPRSEQLIAQTLEELRGDITIVVIAHRFQTVQRANNVIVVEDGRVIPHGGDEIGALRSFLVEAQPA